MITASFLKNLKFREDFDYNGMDQLTAFYYGVVSAVTNGMNKISYKEYLETIPDSTLEWYRENLWLLMDAEFKVDFKPYRDGQVMVTVSWED